MKSSHTWPPKHYTWKEKLINLTSWKLKTFILWKTLLGWLQKIFANHISTKDLYLEYTEYSQNSALIKQNNAIKMGKIHEQVFYWRGVCLKYMHMNGYSISLATWEMQINITMSYHNVPIRMAKVKSIYIDKYQMLRRM